MTQVSCQKVANFTGTSNNSPTNLLANPVTGSTVIVTSLGNNLTSDNGGGFLTQASDLPNTNPQLLPLGYYGGTMQTHALLATSPAVDAGTVTGAPTTDQRGLARGVEGNGFGLAGYDIGAYELHPKFINVTTGNDANNGLTLATTWQTIAFGIANAVTGDDLVIAGGTYFENNLVIGKSINLQGAGTATTTVDANNVNRVFQINAGLTVGISNLKITHGNSGANPGGGILNSGTLSLAYCLVSGNTTTGFGGGIDNTGLLTISHSTISGNQAGDTDGIGNTGQLFMTHSTISGNQTPLQTGGLNNQGGTATLTNCTISGNMAGSTPGGVLNIALNGQSASLTLTNCTIASNTATASTGGIRTSNLGNGAFTSLKNTMISGNSNASLTASGVNAVVTSLGNNLTNDGGGGFLTGTGDLINTNAMLGLLANNGGPTQTHLPNAGSPAINAGSNTGVPPTDQRGVKRQLGTSMDIGAVESSYEISCPTITLSPATLPPGAVGPFYNQQLTVTGGVAPYVFSVVTGTSLPPGLSLLSGGVLSGYPTTAGPYNFSVVAFDQNGCSGMLSFTFTVAVSACNIGPAATPIAYGQTLTGQLLPGDCVGFIGRYDLYRFNGVAGQGISIALNSTDFDTFLVLDDSAGSAVDSEHNGGSNNGFGGFNARIPATSGFFTLPATGTYYIFASSEPTPANATGNYSLTLTTCSVTLSPPSRNFSAAAASAQTVSVTSGCAWGATSNAAWITLTGATTGTGNGTVNYNVAANSGPSRTGTITVNDQTHTVFQATADATQDSDGDGIPDSVEITEGHNPLVKDNDIYADTPTGRRLFVMQQYRDFLGREGDAGGITNWVNALTAGTLTRAQVIESFFNSQEFSITVAPVVRLYFAAFNRIPDYPGLTNWVNAYRAGMPLTTIAQAFVDSLEFQLTYGNLDNTQFVTRLYHNVLGRDPDSGGLANWVNALNGGMTRGQVLLNFSESAEYLASSSNKVFVVMMYVGMLRRSPDQVGFDNWVAFLNAGNSRLTLIQNFIDAPEYHNRFLP